MIGNSFAAAFVSGMLATGYGVAALFFLRFWKDSRDRLFIFFSVAFALMMVQRVALTWAAAHDANTTPYYVLRLAAFLLIIAAIADKNRKAS